MKPQGEFTEHLWQTILPVYKAILNSNFVQQLTKGTLSRQHFKHYLQQDILYIKDDAEAFSIVANKAPNIEEKAFFKFLSEDGIEMEKVLQNELLAYFNIEKTDKKSLVCRQYTGFLFNHASNSDYPVALSALFPCYWVYSKVGEYILSNTASQNPYKKWVDTYAGDEYKEYTTRFIKIVEKEAGTAQTSTLQEMKNAFLRATQFELDFFEEAEIVC